MFTLGFTPALIAGTAIGWIAARRKSRLQGDIVMAIIAGCAAFHWFELPRRAAEAPPKPHMAIKLSPKQCDAYVGEYEFPPDNYVSLTGMKLRIWRQGDQLMGQTTVMNRNRPAFEIYPESETNLFVKNDKEETMRATLKIWPAEFQFTFVKNDKGETMAVILHGGQELPDSEGKKLNKKRMIAHGVACPAFRLFRRAADENPAHKRNVTRMGGF